jgi:hypothetical protein
MVTATEPIADRPWYRRTLFGVVLTVWAVLLCFVAQARGWLPGQRPSATSLYSLTSTASLLSSFAVGQRSWPVAGALMILAAAFLIATIASFAQGR